MEKQVVNTSCEIPKTTAYTMTDAGVKTVMKTFEPKSAGAKAMADKICPPKAGAGMTQRIFK